MGFGSLIPLVPSITSSHHILSTWPTDPFPSKPSAPRLTIYQANSIFGLTSKCQVLGIKLAKDFRTLSGLEAIHRNSVQGMAHETLTLGHSTREATYMAILQDDITEAEHKATTCCLRSEADAAWRKMHEVMYNHQLEYDRRLSDFLKEAEVMLANMRDQIWTAVRALTESEGVTFKDCLSLKLCILPYSCRSLWTSHTRRRYCSLLLIAWSLQFTGDGTPNMVECPPSVRRSEHPKP